MRFQLHFQLHTDKNLHLTLPSPESVSCCHPRETAKEKERKWRELIRKTPSKVNADYKTFPEQLFRETRRCVCNPSSSSRSPEGCNHKPFHQESLDTLLSLHFVGWCLGPKGEFTFLHRVHPTPFSRLKLQNFHHQFSALNFVSALWLQGKFKRTFNFCIFEQILLWRSNPPYGSRPGDPQEKVTLRLLHLKQI